MESICAWGVERVRGTHGITVLQMLDEMVLQMARLLVQAPHHAGMGLLVLRLGKLRVKLLPLRGALLRLLPLLLLQRCCPCHLLRRRAHPEPHRTQAWCEGNEALTPSL